MEQQEKRFQNIQKSCENMVIQLTKHFEAKINNEPTNLFYKIKTLTSKVALEIKHKLIDEHGELITFKGPYFIADNKIIMYLSSMIEFSISQKSAKLKSIRSDQYDNADMIFYKINKFGIPPMDSLKFLIDWKSKQSDSIVKSLNLTGPHLINTIQNPYFTLLIKLNRNNISDLISLSNQNSVLLTKITFEDYCVISSE